MDYIQQLREQNITFHYICRDEALNIMEKEYSYYKLLEYAELFDRYKKAEKKGTFVKLDFAQLYYLAVIDSNLSKILMCMCLEIENSLKTKLVYNADKVCDTKSFLNEYYSSDKEYLEQTYNSENIEILRMNSFSGEINSLDLNQFLMIIQFGTLEKLIRFFYKQYAPVIYECEFAPYEKQLYSVRRIRNIVAHNISVIAKLNLKNDYKNLEMSAFLGKRGIKHKTLKTNMSKAIVSDLCNLLYVYFNIVPNSGLITNKLREFDDNYCKLYHKFFLENSFLTSVYIFMKSVVDIFEKDYLTKS